MNARETYSNMKLISTALMLVKRGYIKGDEIRHGLLAYTLSTRYCKTEFLALQHEQIDKAFRVSNQYIT